MSNKHDGPLFCCKITQALEWSIELKAKDASGERTLGYRASGTVGRRKVPSGYGIQVHDADRAVWTTMPINDRKDIRQQFDAMLTQAMESLVSHGHLEGLPAGHMKTKPKAMTKYTIEQIDVALAKVALLMQAQGEHGLAYLPIFERLEREREQMASLDGRLARAAARAKELLPGSVWARAAQRSI
ncbi:hypothetical protein [Mesorhizobium sp.]|uniref:hypothetical protein n=1 Tax=Mesorhizobium sp. TaxID=1871066 RepID=UPI000FE4F19F|nr:hypothetical protein [Mesorhizobium sp.]RWK41124.1 MAG: hypothetical protein EOR46_17810 [Mesorhizobium sp.]RWK67766.1 MAG: hypothetical protein EOR54_17185 [Mesorhizobium sp.]RWK78132.1 MAG: hypothetical protein EOR50_10035 [Mesorhizobium sp.]RWK80442.1 MAG: hypothetical protein EOR51_18420 [Mesorhizobium sp.]RWL03894.1 MAG: hypothetical protein EOR55_17645 [Mesorhizobium sp.]